MIFALAVLLQATAGTDRLAQEAILLAKCWEARFKGSVIEFRPHGRESESVRSDKLRLVNWPGRVQLWNSNDRVRPLIVVQDGEAWYRTEDSQSASQWSYFAGTELSADIKWAAARAVEILQQAGALLADMPMSDAIEQGSVRSTCVVTGGGIKVVFQSPAKVGLGNSEVSVVYDRSSASLRSYSVLGPKRQLHFIVRNSGASKLSKGKGVYEVFVSGSANEVAGTGAEPERLLTTILAIRPIVKRPALFKPPDGDRVLESAVETFFVMGRKTTPLDPYLARETLAVALRGEATIPEKAEESEALRCGPDTLYYLLKLKGASVEPDLLLEKFPDLRMGASIAQLAAASRELGQPLRTVSSRTKNIRSIRTPAILHVRPSHFVVLLGTDSGGRVVWISPPYEVRVTPPSELTKIWTGRAMWIE